MRRECGVPWKNQCKIESLHMLFESRRLFIISKNAHKLYCIRIQCCTYLQGSKRDKGKKEENWPSTHYEQKRKEAVYKNISEVKE